MSTIPNRSLSNSTRNSAKQSASIVMGRVCSCATGRRTFLGCRLPASVLETIRDGRSAAFSPGGKQFAIGGTKIAIYDAETRKSIGELQTDQNRHAARYTAIAFSRDGSAARGRGRGWFDRPLGRRVSAAGCEPCRATRPNASRWPLAPMERGSSAALPTARPSFGILPRAKKFTRLRGHYAELTSVWFSPDDRLVATAARDGAAIYWDAASGKQLLMVVTSDLHQDWLAVTPDGLYDGSEPARIFYSLRAGDGVDPAEAYRATGKLYRPGLAEAILSGRNPN